MFEVEVILCDFSPRPPTEPNNDNTFEDIDSMTISYLILLDKCLPGPTPAR